MTVQEALETLGITAEATADEVRRAYLRLLKQHKPEVDPEGFRRLREAYELAKEALENPALRILAQSPHVELVLRDARSFSAAEIRPDEIFVAQAEVESDATDLHNFATKASQLAADGETGRAIEVLRELTEELEKRPHSVGWLLHELGKAVLHLVQAGEREAAKSVAATIDRLLAANNWPGRSPQFGFWALCREIASLPAEFPRSAVEVLTQAYLGPDSSLAYESFEQLSRTEPEGVSRAAALLPRDSMLFELYYAHLVHLPTRSEPRSADSSEWSMLLPILVIAAILVLPRMCSNSRPVGVPIPSYPVTAPAPGGKTSETPNFQTLPAPRPRSGDPLARYERTLERACGKPVDLSSPLCATFEDLLAAVQTGDCARIRPKAKSLRLVLDRAFSADATSSAARHLETLLSPATDLLALAEGGCEAESQAFSEKSEPSP